MKKRSIFLIVLLTLTITAFSYVAFHNMTINDIGLKVLTWIKRAKGQAVDLKSINTMNTPVVDHISWTELLQEHVDNKGKVDYGGFIESSSQLSQYLEKLSSQPPGINWTQEEEMAYWINAYNAFTIQLILDHYPLKSIKDISDGLPMIDSPWDMKFFTIGGVDFDLNTIEHEILRKKYNEPRIHFAINCASISCPNLRNEAYTAVALEEQLEQETRGFINDTNKNIINQEETQLSSIFEWFQSDFSRTSDVKTFVEKYAPQMNRKNKIQYLDYNWNLNN